MGNVAAFFDIDGTLYRNSLMIQHFKKMLKYEVIDPLIWHSSVKHTYDEWEKRFGDFEDYLEELAAVYIKELKGVNKSYIEFIASQVINLNGDKVYKYSRTRIDWHKKQGHKVFFISGSPDFLVSKMAEKYGVTEFKGTIYEVDEKNNFTGEILRMWDSENKQRVIDEFVEKYDVDLPNSFAYGDTKGDLSMLRMVGNPVAINPNRDLFNCIKNDPDLSNKTTIIVERKDIVYKLNPDVEIVRGLYD
ncbi:HAD-superfamily subfamily IB hydrolase, TIGR01490 [Proteiniborus ethanoligenes]|uniref:phosphoserine phosphatase n=1 Tax=Proteiniborus ethanoligenes TaxID=415015 RepID=A0A1H3MKE1_9FIRM|nr:HAD-IB family hydrolase [Proteiniborus ethanoligenes]TAH63922.1 MAG: HAD-IB family hydrolase [Gottschalkiaceae bacterium]SDY77147.1 HAD-superfamily subfamily IB hydrolase, TIGR01490 [Proteiniborus ethanoligenes]